MPGLLVPLAAAFLACLLDLGIHIIPLLFKAARIFLKWVAILVQDLGRLFGAITPPSFPGHLDLRSLLIATCLGVDGLGFAFLL